MVVVIILHLLSLSSFLFFLEFSWLYCFLRPPLALFSVFIVIFLLFPCFSLICLLLPLSLLLFVSFFSFLRLEHLRVFTSSESVSFLLSSLLSNYSFPLAPVILLTNIEIRKQKRKREKKQAEKMRDIIASLYGRVIAHVVGHNMMLILFMRILFRIKIFLSEASRLISKSRLIINDETIRIEIQHQNRTNNFSIDVM